MPTPGQTITGPDGKVRVWQPDTRNSDNFDYLGPASGFATAEEAHMADIDSGDGSYVPGSYAEHWPWWLKAFVATGLGSAAITGVGALAAPGAFGAGAGAGVGGGTGYVGADIASVAAHGAPAAAGGGSGGVAGLVKGGTLSKLGSAGQILNGYAQGAAQGRQAEANLNLGTDTLRQRQAESERQDALDRSRLEMDQRTRGQELESQARGQEAWGKTMEAGPVTFSVPDNIKSHMGSITGGIPDFSGIGEDAYRSAQQRLLTGSDKQFTTPPNIPTPGLTPQPNESSMDKIMRIAGLLTGTAGALGGYRPPVAGGR